MSEENSESRRFWARMGLALALAFCVFWAACASPPSKTEAPQTQSASAPRAVWNIGPESYVRAADEDAGCAQYGYSFTDEPPHRFDGHVPFTVGRAEVPPDAKPLLDKLAAQLNDPHPKIVKVAVLGYAGASEDKVLAQGRANAVLGELISRGVPSSRVEAHGIKGELPPGMPRAAVVFEVLVEYRGGLQRWADGGLAACGPNDPAPECAVPPESARTCIRKAR